MEISKTQELAPASNLAVTQSIYKRPPKSDYCCLPHFFNNRCQRINIPSKISYGVFLALFVSSGVCFVLACIDFFNGTLAENKARSLYGCIGFIGSWALLLIICCFNSFDYGVKPEKRLLEDNENTDYRSIPNV